MDYSFRPMDETDAREVLSWEYPPPYQVYNADPLETSLNVPYLTDPVNQIYALHDASGTLVAFCSFGRDAQVPGGDYAAPAVDIGLGVRPSLTGQGRGGEFVEAVLHFARQSFTTPAFRVTIAEFNQRAARVWEKAGFQYQGRFLHAKNGAPFRIFTKTNL